MDDRSLYQTVLGLEAPWRVVSVAVESDREEIVVRVEREGAEPLGCPECGRDAPGYDRAEERRWRHLDTCQYRTILVARIPRVKCAAHGVRQVRVPWAEDRSRFTALFEALAIRVLRETTVAGMAELMRLSWHEAEGIFRRAVERGLARRSQQPVRVLGVDETSFQKRFEYVTIVADLEERRVLWVGDHRRQETLQGFWEGLPEAHRGAVKVVVMDMWDAYIAATREGLPEGSAKIVFDRFHVVQHLNEAVDEVRRAEQRELRQAGEQERAQALKGTRFVLLRGEKRRTEADEERIRQLQESGLKVGLAWALKERALEFWKCPTATSALQFFENWERHVEASGLQPMRRVATMMRKYMYGLLAYIWHPYTNALTEGLNSKIQEIKYRARGYRNRDNFRLAILFHCGGLAMDPR